MREKFDKYVLWLKEHKVRTLSVSIIALLILISLTALYFKQDQKKSAQQQLSQLNNQPPSQLPSASQSPPQVSFSSYDNKAILPTVPQTVNGYTFKANYTSHKKEFGFDLMNKSIAE